MKSSHPPAALARHLQRSGRFYHTITDTTGNFKYVNPHFIEKSGYSSAQLSSLSFLQLIAEKDAGKYNAHMTDCINRPQDIHSIGIACRRQDGSFFNITWELSAVLNKNDEPEGIQWIGVDEKPDENHVEKLMGVSKDVQERFDAYEYSAEGLWKIDLKRPVSVDLTPEEIIEHCRQYGYLGECNDNMARMYGFIRAEELRGTSLSDLIDLDDPARIENLKQFVRNNFHSPDIETKEYDRSGNTVYFLNNMKGIIENGMLQRIWGTQQDITEKKKAEEQRQKRELFYRNLIADSLDGILLTDDTGVISFASASIKKILGFGAEELIGKNALEYLHPEDRPEDISGFYNAIARSSRSEFISARLLQKSGNWLWCMVRGHNMFDNPHVGAMLIYIYDDTLRRNTEAALTESEQRFRHLIQNLSLGVILVNEKGEILIFNQATADMFGLTKDQLTGRNVLNTDLSIIREDGSTFLHSDFPIAVAIQTKGPVKDVVMGISRSPDEERMWLLVSAEPVLDGQAMIRHVISSFTDITELKRLSRQLVEQEIQKQKQLMQVTIDAQERERREIGRELHDNISQHITTTRLYLEIAKDKARGELLKMINLAHKGLLDIVTEIRQLSQSLVPPSLNDIGLIASIEDICQPLKNIHAFAINFEYREFEESTLPDNMKLMLFRIIQEQINNILRHANASTICISLENSIDKLMLTVSDNGRGFDPATVKKGFGLDNISNRAGLFGGTLKIDSAPGKGCMIRVVIPILPTA